MSFLGFGKKAKKAEAAKEAQQEVDRYNLWRTEQKSLNELTREPTIPEGFNAMKQFNKNLVNKSRNKAKAAENARIAKVKADAEAAIEEKCRTLIENARECLSQINTEDDLDYYCRINGKIENYCFPTLREFIRTSPMNETCRTAVNNFINEFKEYISSKFGNPVDLKGNKYIDYFEKSSNDNKVLKEEYCISLKMRNGYGYEQAKYICETEGGGRRKRKATRKSTRKTHRKTRRV